MRRAQALDDVPVFMKKARTTFMVKRCISEKGKEKQLEKELPWGMIHPDDRQHFRDAELKQWEEHVDFGAVRPLSLEESEKVRRTADPTQPLCLRGQNLREKKNQCGRACQG